MIASGRFSKIQQHVMNTYGADGWKKGQTDSRMIQDNSHKKMMLGCVKIHSQVNLSDPFSFFLEDKEVTIEFTLKCISRISYMP